MEAEKAYSALTMYARSLRFRVYTSGPTPLQKSEHDIDLGVNFKNLCMQYSRGRGEEVAKQFKAIKNRAWGFLLRIVEEVDKRLPPNMEVFKQLSFFSPATVFDRSFGEIPFLECIPVGELEELEEEFRQFKLMNWSESSPFKDLESLPKDPVAFWVGVLSYTMEEVMAVDVEDPVEDPDDVAAENPFYKLASFVLGRFTLAHSTAAVERIFSIVSCVKTKQRNLLKTGMLEAILRIRTYLYGRGLCCRNMEVTKEMLDLFTTQMYRSNSDVTSMTEDADFGLVLDVIPAASDNCPV